MNSKTDLYIIKCITNFHVGTNSSSYGIIDNEVQKDPITNIPIINSSSLKGALREFFTVDIGKPSDSNMITWIFGYKQPSSNEKESDDDTKNSDNEDKNKEKFKEGNFKFFQADLLSRPVRSNKKPYFMATCPMIIKSFLDKLNIFGIKLDDKVDEELKKLDEILLGDKDAVIIGELDDVIFEKLDYVILEDIKAEKSTINFSSLKNLLGKNIALLSDEKFKNLDLPIIARNKLNNGESENLWYEELVPRESKFYFFITKPTNLDKVDEKEKIKGFIDTFDTSITENIVQFGGNKSIGYGFSKISKEEVK